MTAMSAEWGWLDRCGGHARGPALKADDYPTVESLVDAWTEVEGWVRSFLAGLEHEDLHRQVEYNNPRGETRSMALGELLQHGANHGVHHRGQVALLLRVLGYAPGNFDILFYDGERRGGPRGMTESQRHARVGSACLLYRGLPQATDASLKFF